MKLFASKNQQRFGSNQISWNSEEQIEKKTERQTERQTGRQNKLCSTKDWTSEIKSYPKGCPFYI